ncbi:hypothetical protein [Gelidibacter japonicus]|uniref:hypothetical protein n=1 Tax=Gelidibacter japonicus TaxID=1962232 RepID=UPI001F081061|nr:hypothetical protein [Gelidibacter japonicus]
MLEETFGRRPVEFLAMVKIVLDVLDREPFRALFAVQGKVGKAPEVIVQGAFGLAVDGKALLQFVLERTETRHFLESALGNGLTFF